MTSCLQFKNKIRDGITFIRLDAQGKPTEEHVFMRERGKVRYWLDGEVVASYIFMYNDELVTRELLPLRELIFTDTPVTKGYSQTQEDDLGTFNASIKRRKLSLLI